MMRKIAVYVLLTVGALALLFPLWWMIVVSLTPGGLAHAMTASADTFEWWPAQRAWGNYPEALGRMGAGHAEQAAALGARPAGGWAGMAYDVQYVAARYGGFWDALANTVVITTLCVVGQVLSCSLVGYGFARMRFRGRNAAFLVMISTMMLPAQVTMIPLFILFRSLGWINSILPLVVPAFFGAPFFIFMFRQFFAQIPEDLLDAARIDGAGPLRIWARLLLPMCKPVIAITAIFTFIGTWNDFLGPLIYLHNEEQATLAVALNAFRGQYSGVRDVHLLMAAAVVTMAPCIVLFFVAQRHFVKGLNLGAVKG